MEKAIDIHNYENDFKTVMVKMQSSDISAKNKNLIEMKFHQFGTGGISVTISNIFLL